ncbi:Jacalin-like lectin domain - like 2 [Theobroma cacao]|nr:Jacalin-like lectin domain - like 2 [Theobroma cacao]
MENLMIPCTSKPPVIIPTKHENLSEFSQTPTKLAFSNTKKTNNPKISDSHLNYLSRNGRLTEAITALDSIAQSGSQVRANTFINLLQACIDFGSLELGRKLHARIHLVKESDPFVETKLVSMYAKCGSFVDARKVFDKMKERNLYAWSAMIGACSRELRWKEVVELFFLMMEDGVLPDEILFPKFLQACANCGDVRTGRLLHSLVIRLGMVCFARVSNSVLAVYAKCGKLSSARRFFENMNERDIVTWNSMILAYCQKGENDEAYGLFYGMWKDGIQPCLVTWNILINSYNQLGQCDVAMGLMKEMESSRIIPDVFTWTSMISGLAQNGRRWQALCLFKEMLLAGIKPNGVTITSAVSACASLRVLNMGREIHSIALKKGIIDNVLVGNSLIDMYAKCGELEAARQVFDKIEERDVYTWNSMVAGYCQAGYCGKAYELFMKMRESDLKPNVITWNTMISGYIQNGDEDRAMDLFQRMEQDGKIRRNTASWNALIAGYVQLGEIDKAFGVFRQMQSCSVSSNSVTILSILPGCANLVAAKKVKEIHGCVLRRNLEFVLSISNSLIDTYAKSGNILYSRIIFDGMSTRDIISWNSIIGGYVLHGCSDAALDLFNQMRKLGLKPNRGTFLSIILAHGIAGMVDEGKQIFSSISDNYEIIPAVEHYAAMIDVYGRSGRLGEAVEFIEDMPIEPDSSVWTSLLTASRIHRDIALAVLAGERLLDLEPANILINRVMFQIYVLSGKLDDPLKVRKLEKENILRRSLGHSWIEVRNTVHKFVTGDQSKPCADLLFSWVKSIAREVNIHDHHGRFSLEEEEKEETGGVHSEKLTLAFALIGLPYSPQSIRIVKNTRMCSNCHLTANYSKKPYAAHLVGCWLLEFNLLHSRVAKDELFFTPSESCWQALPILASVTKHIRFSTSAYINKELYLFLSKLNEGTCQDDGSLRDSIDEKVSPDRIGIWKRVGDSQLLEPMIRCHQNCFQFDRITFAKSLEDDNKPISVGPWGGQGGSSWDDGVYFTVRQLVIAHGSGIDSIQIEYDNKGNSIWSKKHGGGGGSKTDKVKLDYPDEFLTSVHGYYGILHERGPILVRSLTFFSNRKAYGPYGIEQGTSFSMTRGKIVGFHGRCGCFLDAIGTHSKPFSKLNPSKTIVHAQSFVADGAEKVGYSLIQGSVGEKYDIVLAVRQRDAYGNPLPRQLSRQSSSSSDDSSDVETRSKVRKKSTPCFPFYMRDINFFMFVALFEVSFRTPEKVPSKLPEGVLSYGPWGGNGGAKFDDGTYTGIRQITLSRNVGIVWIKACYDRDGQAVWGSKHGGTGGFKTDRIIFDYPSEILTHITGTFGPLMYMGPNVIKSLTFHTNKGKHGPHGDEQGPSFTNKMNEGRIIGFHGREGLFLDAVGVYVMEGKVPPPRPSISQAIIQSERSIAEIDNSPWSNKLVLARRGPVEEVACGVVKEPAPCGPGPWGGEGGRPWDDGVFSGIKQIFVTKSEAICSIQFEYDRNGQSVWSVKHGGHGGTTTHRVKLDHPHEVLICISGYYGPINNEEKSKVVRSLTFYSSRGKYGPFGEEIGTYFTSTTTEGKVVGFHGRNSSYLDAIGVHMQHWLGNQRTSRMSLFKIFS